MNICYRPFTPPAALAVMALALAACTPSHSAESLAPRTTPMQSVSLPAEGYSQIAKAALPAVASVYSSRTVKAPEVPPMLAPFFGGGEMQPRREHGLGSAVVIREDGVLLTNNHVVEGADEVTVKVADGRELDAKVVGTDPKTDIAVLRVDAKRLPTLPFSDSSKVQVGEFVLAIGNPFGVGQTMTFGIVSAIGRGGLGIEQYEDFIQTDAAINPGNSGGALINTEGELIGINTAIVGPQGANNGIGFAVPVNMARAVMDQILDHGRVIRGWMGIAIQPLTEKEAKFFKVPNAGGALIGDVTEGSPAEKAGLKRGDVIVSLDGQPVEDSRALVLKVSAMQPGAEAKVELLRDGKTMTIPVRLGESPQDQMEASSGGKEAAPLGGIEVQNLEPAIARQLGLLANTQGVVVTGVDPSSAWAEAGLRGGDVIAEVNRKPVKSARDFEQAARQAERGDSLLLLVNREGSTTFMVVDL